MGAVSASVERRLIPAQNLAGGDVWQATAYEANCTGKPPSDTKTEHDYGVRQRSTTEDGRQAVQHRGYTQ